jgi:hypothetical protein
MNRLSLAATALFAASRLAAQSPPSQRNADSLLQQGLVEQAETMYYAAVRAAPRSPDARLRLGRYLIARGATRVGAVLIEEAVQFGLDPATAAPTLAAAYEYLGDFQSLTRLSPTTLGSSAIVRARWLVDHPMRVAAPDSVIVVDFRERMSGDTIGTVPVRINARSVTAVISARARGITLGTDLANAIRARRFESVADSARAARLAVVDSIDLGRLSVRNSPIHIDASGAERGVVIGLDALMRFAATFDGGAGKLALRPSGAAGPRPPQATEIATLLVDGELLTATAGGWASIAVPNVARLLRGHRWTIDTRRGRISVER